MIEEAFCRLHFLIVKFWSWEGSFDQSWSDCSSWFYQNLRCTLGVALCILGLAAVQSINLWSRFDKIPQYWEGGLKSLIQPIWDQRVLPLDNRTLCTKLCHTAQQTAHCLCALHTAQHTACVHCCEKNIANVLCKHRQVGRTEAKKAACVCIVLWSSVLYI